MSASVLRVLCVPDGHAHQRRLWGVSDGLARANPAYSLTVTTAKAGAYGLKVGLVWWVLGMILWPVTLRLSTALSPAKWSSTKTRTATAIEAGSSERRATIQGPFLNKNYLGCILEL